MKNFKKVLAVMTAVASLCMSATAFAAAEGSVSSSQDLAGTYDVATNVLNITNNNAVLDDSETTILVLTSELTDDEAANVTEGKIMYINQQNTKTDGKNFTDMGLKLPTGSETLGVGSYPVKVGCYNATTGDFEIKNATLEVTDAGSGEKSFNIQWGEVDGNGTATVADAAAILTAKGGGTKTFTDADGRTFTWGSDEFTHNGKTYKMTGFQWGEVDGNGVATVADAAAILTAKGGGTKTFTDEAGNSYTWGSDTYTGSEEKIKIVYEEVVE